MNYNRPLFTFAVIIIATLFFANCSKNKNTEDQTMQQPSEQENKLEVKKTTFGKINDTTEIYLFTLKNKNNMEVRITNYGGIITHIITPDKSGNLGDVVLGFDSLSGYLSEVYAKEGPYFGALIGRYGNRIAKGKFTLEGKEYNLAKNNGPNHLHGGIKGFDKVVWEAEDFTDPSKVGVKLTYHSKDMEEGYPGNLDVTVNYSLNNDNELVIDYEATTDKKTHINLTNHSYFNLSAGNAKDVLSHVLTIYADKYTPVDAGLIPTGEIVDVKGTGMDFTTPTEIGKNISQIQGGYDHNYVLNGEAGKSRLIAKVLEPTTGRLLEVHTDHPGVQFYSGNFLNGNLVGKADTKYTKHYGFCLETQHFPDSPNQPNFPSTVLSPGETFKSSTTYKFTVKENAE